MRITDMNWMQVEAYLRQDDRCVLPLGSTEQHAYLSLSVDSLLAERVALEAAEPLGIPVFPVVHYGLTPYFRAYPGTVTLRIETYMRLLRDIFASLTAQGFRRILVVNGHGGNSPAQGLAQEWMADYPGHKILWHNWWSAPRTWAQVMAIDSQASHASWMENFPWTRLPGVAQPPDRKPMANLDQIRALAPAALRAVLGDGSYGGYYQRSDEDTQLIWQVAVEETRGLLMQDWGS